MSEGHVTIAGGEKAVVMYVHPQTHGRPRATEYVNILHTLGMIMFLTGEMFTYTRPVRSPYCILPFFDLESATCSIISFSVCLSVKSKHKFYCSDLITRTCIDWLDPLSYLFVWKCVSFLLLMFPRFLKFSYFLKPFSNSVSDSWKINRHKAIIQLNLFYLEKKCNLQITIKNYRLAKK